VAAKLSHPFAIIAGMRTTTYPSADFVTTSFSACGTFTASADGSLVCDACGWLRAEHDDDHDEGIAEVRALPGKAQVRPRPKRLAS
jgi:hypothetical protein